MKYLLVLLASLLCCAAPVSAQSITAYEVAFARQDAPAVAVKVLSIPAVNISCTEGPASVPSTVQWLAPNAAFKIQFEPDVIRVCSYQAPAGDLSGLSSGVLYVATLKAVNEAGLKSEVASPASNPFGVAGPPANILRVGVSK